MPSSMSPEVRASHLKDDLLALAQVSVDAEARVLARAAKEDVQRIRESTRLEWLPAELNARLADAVFAELGAEGARTWGRLSIVQALDTPFLRALVSGAVALFGLSPVAYFKYAPLVWNAIYRGCGALATVIDQKHARITAGPLPTPLATVAFKTALAGSFEGAFTFCKVEGEVTFEQSSVTRPLYLATWRD